MSVGDGQRLGVLDSVCVTFKCFVSHVHGEVCRLGYRLAGRHVDIFFHLHKITDTTAATEFRKSYSFGIENINEV